MSELWRNPWMRLATTGIVLALLAWAIVALGDILFPLLLAWIFAYIFDPVIDWFEARKLSRGMGIFIVLSAAGLVLLGLAVYVVPSMIAEVGDLTTAIREQLPAWQERLHALTAQYHDHALVRAGQARMAEALAWLQSKVPALLESGKSVAGTALQGTLGFAGLLTNFVLFSIVAIYLLYDFDPLVARIGDLVPHPYRDRTARITGRINENVRNFFRGQITVCAILTVIYTTGLLLFNIPFAPLLGLVGGFGQLIPYVGTLLGAIPAVLLALIEHHTFVAVGGAAGTFVVGQMCEGMLITPKIVGDKVGLHPVVVILALMVFTKILGFVGLLLAVPLAAALKVLLSEALVSYRQSSFYLGTPPAPTPAAGDAAPAEPTAQRPDPPAPF